MSSRLLSEVPAAMRAAVLVEPGRIEIRETPLPAPGPGEVLLQLEGCGVCASNLSPWEGQPWFTYPMEPGALGHEAWGYIAALGEGVTGVSVGQRVAALSNRAYAEYNLAAADRILPLPPALNSQPFPGEPLACAFNIFKRSQVRAGQSVAIVGIGFLGALLTRLAALEGAKVLAIARRPFAQGIARQMGATEVIPMDDHWQIIEQVKAWTGGEMCPVVIECVGKQWPLDLASELTGVDGRLVVAGYHQDGPRQVNMQSWNWKGIDVINAHERDSQVCLNGMESAITAVAEGRIDPEPLLTHRLPLEQLGEALNMTRDRPEGFLKAVIHYP